MKKLFTLVAMLAMGFMAIAQSKETHDPIVEIHYDTIVKMVYVRDTVYIYDCKPGAYHEYVDLGLSVRWATFNIGAVSPEDYGYYFAWGETESKSNYTWETYKYCEDRYNSLVKYCSKSTYGENDFTDKKTVLVSNDDVARVDWGDNWRMPTRAEQEELLLKCTWTWTSQNGVNGYLVTSNVEGYTDKSIFLPAAGYMYEDRLNYAGSIGVYWSSTLNVNYPNRAYGLLFDSEGPGWNYDHRNFGEPIRPVSPKAKKRK